ncbi:MAG: PA14 domain-containing protein, partial [Phycisphaerales bacterium]|nr:PA14 domain-containing protein [Phycisphaerales bacterium]
SEVVSTINYPSTGGNFAGSGRADQVGAGYTGYLDVPATDFYTLSTASDDGSRLLIGGTVVVDNNGLHGMTERSGTIALKQGLHAIRVEFFENGGGAGLIASVMASKGTRQIIPATMWRHDACLADFDGSGFVDIEDYTAFVTAFEAGDTAADVDQTGFVDLEDFTLFVQVFEEGC